MDAPSSSDSSTYLHKPQTVKNEEENGVSLINTANECDHFVDQLNNNFNQYGFRAIGFDCEWISRRGGRTPVLLIQMAFFDPSTNDKPCGLIRLSKLGFIPDSLKTILEDPNIYKVGVATVDDARNLHKDYSVNVMSVIDLRFLAIASDYEAGGIARLAQDVCGLVLKKNKKVQCGNWKAEKLSNKQIQYAADDARAALQIFEGLLSRLLENGLNKDNIPDWSKITTICAPHLDQKFNDKEYLNELCKRSVVIKNVPESKSHDINIQKEHDKNEAEEIVKSVAEISTDGLKVSRIGKKHNPSQDRRMSVVFKSEEDANTVLKYKDQVKKPFIIEPDLFNKWVNARIKQRQRTKRGEKNPIIKNVRKIPTVVFENSRTDNK